MTPEPWISDEPRLAPVARWVVARARRRQVLLLVAALLATGAFTARRAFRQPTCVATLYFRLVEGDVTDPDNSPRPPREIREYISAVALSRSRVERIMRKHAWSSAFLARDRERAIDEFRDEIEIDVSRNYFIYDRQATDEPRSAYVTISLKGANAEMTQAVLREIGDAIVQDQASQRKSRFAQTGEMVEGQLAHIRARITSLQRRIGVLQLEPAGTRATVQPQIAALEIEVASAIEQMLTLQRLSSEVAFSTVAEDHRLGLNFELFDESLVASSPRLTRNQLVKFAAVVFAIVLVLLGLVVGTFDDRIWSPEDLDLRGLPLFGALRHFPGDDAGSYSARTRIGDI